MPSCNWGCKATSQNTLNLAQNGTNNALNTINNNQNCTNNTLNTVNNNTSNCANSFLNTVNGNTLNCNTNTLATNNLATEQNTTNNVTDLNSFLENYIGRKCSLEFAVGNNLVKRTGTLSGIGNEFLVLTSLNNGSNILFCDTSNLVFVKVE